MEFGNIEVFLEHFTIASACNKVLRKRFFKPETIGLIHAGGYSCNNTWVIDEVRLAVENVYKILEIYEVYEYHVTQYDPKTAEGGFFVD